MMYAELMGNHKKQWIKSRCDNKIDVELGHIQEVGRYVPAIGKRLKNEYVKPRPFLRPAVENHLTEYKSIIENELKK